MYAPAAGLDPRDVKPANILIDRAGTVQLTDFGLARPVMGDDAILENLIVGTPRYMAPEQVFVPNVGPWADFFSLGCVAYELLTGNPLFDAVGFDDLLHRATRWKPRRDVRALGRGVGAPLRRFLEQCLQPDPKLRRPDLALAESWAAPADAELLGIGFSP